MVLSLKTRYAVRAVLELARHAGEGPVTASAVASAQAVPVKFLENILGRLRQAGMVDSHRGRDGGYSLALPPEAISVGDVIRVIQGPVCGVDCEVAPGRQCSLRDGCVLLPTWEQAHKAMADVFDGTMFAELVARAEYAMESGPRSEGVPTSHGERLE